MRADGNNECDSTSSSLLERAKANDNEAWARLVHFYGPIAYRRARLRGLDAEAAGDVVQDVMLAVATSIGSFERKHGKGSFRGWLRTITENKILDSFRRTQGRPVAGGGTTAQVAITNLAQPESDDMESLSDDDERAILMDEALKSLEGEFEEHNLKAFRWMVVEGLTSREASEKFGGTAAGMRQSKRRIISRLQEELGELLE